MLHFFIFENDLRQEMIAKYLVKQGCIKLSKEEISNADFIMLPFVNRGDMEEVNHEFISKLNKKCVVFTGAKNETLRKQFEKYNIKFVEIIKSKSVATLNAIPTAEGVIYNALGELDKTIFGSKILVIGYGICGSEIAKKLHYLGSEVDTLEIVRTKNVRAKTMGINVVDKDDIAKTKYDLIINTVPKKVFDINILKNVDKETIIFDIASPPFGFDEYDMKALNLKYKRLRGLPSKFGLQFSGEMISEYIIAEVRGVKHEFNW